MRRLASLFIVLCAVTALHAEKQPITFGELPYNAKVFVFTYFKGVPFTEVSIERRASLTQYEVELEGGFKLEFDRTGLCTEVENKRTAIPDEVMPRKIIQTVKKLFPTRYITKYENSGRMYEVKLDNDAVLTFSRTLRLVDIEEDETN